MCAAGAMGSSNPCRCFLIGHTRDSDVLGLLPTVADTQDVRATHDLCMSCWAADEGLMALAKGCSLLRYLNLTWCIQLTDRGFTTLAACCHHLQWLSLHGIRGLTDKSVHALSASCARSLRTLDIHGCCNAGLSGDLDKLRALFPSVVCWRVHS